MVMGWPASGSLMYCVRSNDPANVNSYIEVDFRMSGGSVSKSVSG